VAFNARPRQHRSNAGFKKGLLGASGGSFVFTTSLGYSNLENDKAVKERPYKSRHDEASGNR
jgi:hypothetical protein